MLARAARAAARRLHTSAPLGEPAAEQRTSSTLADCWPKAVVDDVYRSSFRRQTGVSLKCARPAFRAPVRAGARAQSLPPPPSPASSHAATPSSRCRHA